MTLFSNRPGESAWTCFNDQCNALPYNTVVRQIQLLFGHVCCCEHGLTIAVNNKLNNNTSCLPMPSSMTHRSIIWPDTLISRMTPFICTVQNHYKSRQICLMTVLWLTKSTWLGLKERSWFGLKIITLLRLGKHCGLGLLGVEDFVVMVTIITMCLRLRIVSRVKKNQTP